jgi:hypothetical protein
VFDDCKSLSEIEIPASVEVLHGFRHCSKLMRITFSPACRLQMIKGFANSFIRSLELPASVESIIGFESRCLSQLIFAAGTRIKRIKVKKLGLAGTGYTEPVFVAYDEGDLRKSRRRFNLACNTVYQE